MLKTVRGWFSSDLSIDLGTANTLIYMRNKGIVLDEPSVVAMRQRDGATSDGVICAVGSEAKSMLGRTPLGIKALRPLRDGVIADLTVTERMLKEFIKRAHQRALFTPSPRILVCVPCRSTQVERRAIRESAENSGARKVYLIEEPMAAAIGAELPISKPHGSMVLDIGGGTSDIAVLSMNGIVYSDSVRIGGNHLDEAISAYVRRQYGCLIGEITSERIKHAIGCAYPLDQPEEIEVRGRSIAEGVPRTLVLGSSEIMEAMSEPLGQILNAVKMALERTPPELSSDVAERGIALTGGGALLRNMDKLLLEETGVPVFIASDPLTCVVRGGGIYLDMLDKYGEDKMLYS